MSGGCKRILSPFTGRKKRKARNKIREKYMPEERRKNLAKTDMGSYYQSRGMVGRILRTIKVHFTMVLKVMIVIMVMRITGIITKTEEQMFFKISVLKNFANFTGKHLCLSFFLIKNFTT